MKYAVALATLALVAASPFPKSQQKRSDGLSYNKDGVAQFPHASPGACDTNDSNCCSSGEASCEAGWSCWQAIGRDHCCPPGYTCDENAMSKIANDDVDSQLKPCTKHTSCWLFFCTSEEHCT